MKILSNGYVYVASSVWPVQVAPQTVVLFLWIYHKHDDLHSTAIAMSLGRMSG